MKDNEIGEQVLQTTIKMYVRVRAFSHAKNATESHTLKQKSLRRDLKRQHIEIGL